MTDAHQPEPEAGNTEIERPGDSETAASTEVASDATPSEDEHFDRGDERWEGRGNIRSWMILAFMVAAYLVWTGIIYFFEPGIR